MNENYFSATKYLNIIKLKRKVLMQFYNKTLTLNR